MMPNATNHENQVVALVRKFANFKSLEEMKYHNACFSGYRDVGKRKNYIWFNIFFLQKYIPFFYLLAWNAFIYTMRNLTGDDNWYCNDAKMVSGFFNESCVPNLNSWNHTFPKNLYSICHASKKLPYLIFRLYICCLNLKICIFFSMKLFRYTLIFFAAELKTRELTALKCLAHTGDVAFTKLDNMTESFKGTFRNGSKYIIPHMSSIFQFLLCLNNTISLFRF